MPHIDKAELEQFVKDNIEIFHTNRLKSLESVSLINIIKRKNPYLFKAKNIQIASEFVEVLLDAYLSASEEKLFGDFLELLAIFIAQKTRNGWKSSTTGIDLEFIDSNTHYLVSVKSGPNWGNDSQQRKQEEDFNKAVRTIKQSSQSLNVQPVLGICYGKTKTNHHVRGAMKVVGQNFWYLVSKNKNLYKELIEPLGHDAKKHTDDFVAKKNRIINKLTLEFANDYCTDGNINWENIVEINSGNLDLDLGN